MTALATKRLTDLLYRRKDLGAFGLGTVRSLEDYAWFSGIDYIHRTIKRVSRAGELRMIGVISYQHDQTTLISGPAKDAIGTNGLKRLETFFRLQAGWDGTASKPIDLNSVAVFSRFFVETRLNPKRLGVFMSARGNVVVNWPEQDGQLVELEFHSGGVDYFIESVGDEGTVANDDVGFSRLFQLVSESVAA